MRTFNTLLFGLAALFTFTACESNEPRDIRYTELSEEQHLAQTTAVRDEFFRASGALIRQEHERLQVARASARTKLLGFGLTAEEVEALVG